MPTTLNETRDLLESLEEKRSSLIEAMSKISARFVVQLADELPHRWEQIVRLHVTDMPEAAKAQGREGLASLKTHLSDLQATAHEVAATHLSGSRVWRHEEADRDSLSRSYASGTAAISPSSSPGRWSRVSVPISKAEGEVLRLLEPIFGPNGPWHQAGGGRLSLPLEEMIKAYQTLDVQLDEVEAELRRLEREISTAEAEELWDSA